mmetsp:Transcript_12062/g.25468  ORF Transcript_12062/g.25468 Transcript_12062/m.25468 type:complete len:479 (+) Transcript_12062:74-1510(+)
MPRHPLLSLRQLSHVIVVILYCISFVIPLVESLSTRLPPTKRPRRYGNSSCTKIQRGRISWHRHSKSRFPCCPAAATCIRLTNNDVDENTELRFLKDVKAVWTKYTDYGNLPYESALRALKAYHEVHGNLVIPRGFIVPSTDEYPPEWHGAKLSRHIYNMKWWQKHIAQHSHRVAQLNQLGFVWERLQPEWNLFMESLVYYSSMYGNVMVPSSFVIPHEDERWPKATWGYPLGNVVYRVRFRNDFLLGENAVERKNQLDGLGFVFDVSEHNFLKFFRALRMYSKIESENNSRTSSLSPREHTTIRVPSKFVIPTGKEFGWPEDLWGYPLGAKCLAVRQKELYIKNHPDRKKALEEIGFRFSGNATLGWLDVVHAAAIYSQMHNRTLNVPFDFVVPAPPSSISADNVQIEDSWPWPERLWGLRLGQRLKDVRLKGAYLKGSDAHIRRAQLDALGFVWSPRRGRRKRALGGGNAGKELSE